MNYYPHHIGDFRSGTVNMSRLARWIYRDMIDVYYDTEKPLPLDLDVLCDLIGVETDEEIKVVERLLRFKFTRTDEGYRHDRCEAEITKFHAKAVKAKENGKRGAATRYKNGEYMPSQGELYAVRVSPDLIKVGITANMKSRLHQLRTKYGSHAYLVHQVTVSKMGDAEADLLSAYEKSRSGEELPIDVACESHLISHMDRIAVAYPVASESHSGSHTNQEPRTKNQEPQKEKPKARSADADAFALPDFIPADAWKAYAEMRAKIRKPMTPHARDLVIKSLRRMHEVGIDIEVVLNNSTLQCWTNVYPPKMDLPRASVRASGVSQPQLSDINAEAKRLLFGSKTNEVIDV